MESVSIAGLLWVDLPSVLCNGRKGKDLVPPNWRGNRMRDNMIRYREKAVKLRLES